MSKNKKVTINDLLKNKKLFKSRLIKLKNKMVYIMNARMNLLIKVSILKSLFVISVVYHLLIKISLWLFLMVLNTVLPIRN
jgi:hypothetical protein